MDHFLFGFFSEIFQGVLQTHIFEITQITVKLTHFHAFLKTLNIVGKYSIRDWDLLNNPLLISTEEFLLLKVKAVN